MGLLQLCWIVFFSLGFYFWIFTNWSEGGNILIKGAASFFMSFVVAIIVFIGGSVFKWFGG